MPEQHISPDYSHYDTLDYAGDHDTYGIYLTPGWHSFDVYGSDPVYDPTLALTSYWGDVTYAYSDDYGGTLDPHIDWYEPNGAWYALDVGEFLNNDTGGYWLYA